jgi:hypothetical protein
MMTHDASLARLKEMYPWPATRPAVSPIDWAMDGGGRSLVTDAIRKHNLKVILEVGVFLGGSLRTWLEASPDVVVLAVDPWEGTWGGVARRFGHPEYAEQLDRDNGPYESFLSSLWEYRDRVIPIRGYSPDVLYEIASMGIVPDLLYLDADKLGREIEVCNELFPGILCSGDDWLHGDVSGFPIRKPVREFCRNHSKHLKIKGHTWLIGDERPSLLELAMRPIAFGHSAERRIRHLRKAFMGRVFPTRAA